MKEAIVLASQKIGQFTINNAPTILTISAGVGVVTTAVTSGRAAVKASRVLEELEYRSETKPTTVDKVKAAGPIFIAPAASGVLTIACILFAHKIHLQREAAIAAAYTMLDSRYREYRDRVVNEIGEKKENRLNNEVAQEVVNKTYPENGLNIIRTPYGDVLFMDWFSGRYFYSSYEQVERAKIKITQIAQSELSVSMNDFYNALDIPTIGGGTLVGWNICDIEDKTFKPEIPIVTNRTCKTPTPEQLPCTILDYDIEPLVDYNRHM